MWVFLFVAVLLCWVILGSKTKTNAEHKSQAAFLPRNSEGEEEVMRIDDARVPEAVRTHGLRFRTPAHFVTHLGNGEYVLSAEDGECLDLIYLK